MIQNTFAPLIGSLMAWLAAHQALAWWSAGLSVLIFAGSLLILPLLVIRLPADYFSRHDRGLTQLHRRHPLIHLALWILKNLLGWLLVIAGLAMLVLPGQGLLTILVGLVLSDFPGKFALERRLASQPRLLAAMNWLRARQGHPPFSAPRPFRDTSSTAGTAREPAADSSGTPDRASDDVPR